MSDERLVLQLPAQRRDVLAHGLRLLHQACSYARSVEGELWEFAVELQELRQLGLNVNDLRWLLACRYVEHAEETTTPGSESRTFQDLGRHFFGERTCFVLSDRGLKLFQGSTRTTKGDVGGAPDPVIGNGRPAPSVTPQRPTWDVNRKELRMGAVVVNRYRSPATNQETILSVFEEEDWPERIDDPLPPVPEQDPKRRLHDTIKCLNRNHRRKAIRFHGDGTGEGVCWEFLDAGPD